MTELSVSVETAESKGIVAAGQTSIALAGGQQHGAPTRWPLGLLLTGHILDRS